MGRAFEFRKARKMKRWDRMSKAFTKLGKEIAIAVKLGGPDPAANPRLRIAITNAKGVNMPKDRIEGAIKRASSKDQQSFEEVVYEGYGPSGVPIIVECATDNPTRTVANIRMHFNRAGGALATTGSLDFLFNRRGVFKIPIENKDVDSLELQLIELGADDITLEDGIMTIYTGFQEFSHFQKALEENGIGVASAEMQRIPTMTKSLDEASEEAVMELIDTLEQDDDVQAVYHNLD